MKEEGAATSPPRFTEDDVGAFLRRSRGSARQARDHLERFAQQRLVAQSRVATITARPTFERTDLLDELQARDTELSAAADELQAQIDALTKACQLLERERSKYVDLFVHAPDAYVVTDLRGTAQDANVAAGALLSVDREFLRGRPLVAFVARNDTRAFRNLVGKLASDSPPGGGVHAFTVRMRPRGQPVFVCLARIATVRTSSGRPIALRWTLRRLEAQETVDAAHLAHAELARHIVGDFRSPVATIAGWARLLLEGSIDGEDERRQALGWIEQSAAAQRVMLDDLDELSDLLSPRDGPLSVETVDLVERVRAAADSLRASADADALVVSEGARAPALVRAPAGYLDRAIDLLLRRALAGTPRSGGVIRSSVSVKDVQATVQIASPDGARVASGWSVRMASVARIVELCGGRLVLDDHSPSSEMTLPLATR